MENDTATTSTTVSGWWTTSSAEGHRIAFLANVLDHNAALISLIDTKAGLILGSVAVLFPLLAFLSMGDLAPGTKTALAAALVPFGITAVFSFLTILPRITARAPGETSIFYTSVAKMDKKEYQRRVEKITPDQIIGDYADNIHALAAIQVRKVKMLACALWSMMASVAAVAAALSIHAYAGSVGMLW